MYQVLPIERLVVVGLFPIEREEFQQVVLVSKI
jgi:hypothetical protein